MRNSSKARLSSACLLGVIIASFLPIATARPAQAKATEERCSPLFQTSTGRLVNASFSAHRYSQENVGAVGISIFPGRTLSQDAAHALGVQLVQALNQNEVEARCFVHFENGEKGSGFDFVITGLSWNDERPLSIVEATDVGTLRAVIAEAKTARSLLHE